MKPECEERKRYRELLALRREARRQLREIMAEHRAVVRAERALRDYIKLILSCQ